MAQPTAHLWMINASPWLHQTFGAAWEGAGIMFGVIV
jgi:hypothetical protein